MPARRLPAVAWMLTAVAVAALAVAARASRIQADGIPAGTDAAYYLVQSRELLEAGRLRYPDAPLVFAIDAAVAWSMASIAAIDAEAAVVRALLVREAIVGALAVPAPFVVAWVTGGRRRAAIVGAVLGATIASMGASALVMIGTFEKQALALSVAGACWASAWLAARSTPWRRGARWAAVAVVLLVLVAGIHVATFFVASLGLLLMASSAAMQRRAPSWVRAALPGALATSCLLGTFVVCVFAPGKAAAIADHALQLARAMVGSPASNHEGMGLPGLPPGPTPVQDVVAWAAASVAGIVASVSVARLVRADPGGRTEAVAVDAAFLLAMALTASAVTCPLLGGDLPRIRLMAIAPLGLAVACSLGLAAVVSDVHRRTVVRRGCRVAAAMAVAAVAVVALNGARSPSPSRVIDRAGREQLAAWRSSIRSPDRTVIAARHGLEYWVAFDLRTHARWGELSDVDFANFDSLYLLQERRPISSSADLPPPPPRRTSTSGIPSGFGNGPFSITRPPPGSRPVLESEVYALWSVPPGSREWYRERRQPWMAP